MQKEKTEQPVFNVPPDGSLGLLALGYRGLVAWRKRREEVREKVKEKKEPDGKENS